MSKKKRKRKVERPIAAPEAPGLPAYGWQGEDGIHLLLGGKGPPTPEQLAEMSQHYQEQLRNSPFWGQMVRQLGRAKAEELLKACRFELR